MSWFQAFPVIFLGDARLSMCVVGIGRAAKRLQLSGLFLNVSFVVEVLLSDIVCVRLLIIHLCITTKSWTTSNIAEVVHHYAALLVQSLPKVQNILGRLSSSIRIGPFTKWTYFILECNLEYRLKTLSQQCRVSWDSIESFALPHTNWGSLELVRSSGWDVYDCYSILTVLTPPTGACYSNETSGL